MSKPITRIEPSTLLAKFVDIVSEGPAGTFRVKDLDTNFISIHRNGLTKEDAAELKNKWGFYGLELRNKRKYYKRFVPITDEVLQVLIQQHNDSNSSTKEEIKD
jgi:hypothetical protein